MLGDAHIFCWHERPLARARNTCSDTLLSAGEGWGEGLTQITYTALSLTLSRDLISHLSAIPFAGEGIVLPRLLFPCRYRAGTTLFGSILNYKILSLTGMGASPSSYVPRPKVRGIQRWLKCIEKKMQTRTITINLKWNGLYGDICR